MPPNNQSQSEIKYELIATCPDEITELLAHELETIGCRDVKSSYRVVYASADERTYYLAHLKSRLASRIYRILKRVPAQSERIIFDKVRRIRFHEYFKADERIAINVTVAEKESKIPGHLIGSKIREAIKDSFQHYQGKEINPHSYDATVVIHGFLQRGKLTISIDTSLKSLHKRGYRVEGHPAPIKETLAAAMLQICDYKGDMPFFDPMCGSGTIAIEAAQIAMKKAAQIHRKKGEFGFEFLVDFNYKLWREIQEEERQRQTPPPYAIYASDIDPMHVEIAKSAALKARVEKYIQFSVADFFQLEKPSETGLLIFNAPYGLRLDETELSMDFIKQIGDKLKQSFKGWRCGVLLPENSPYKHIGLKTEKVRTLVNGNIRVKFCIFDIY